MAKPHDSLALAILVDVRLLRGLSGSLSPEQIETVLARLEINAQELATDLSQEQVQAWAHG